MAGITLDTGALIACDRGDRRTHAFLAAAHRRRLTITIPSVVVAQAWRSPRNARMGQIIGLSFLDGFTAEDGFEAGRLLGQSRASDIVDAAVVIGAASRGDDIVTSDPEDIKRLLPHTRVQGRLPQILTVGSLPNRA